MVTNKDLIPNFVRARTPKLLRKEMFKLASRQKMQMSYFNIQFTGGYWYAWYNMPVSETDEIREQPLASEARDGRIA